MRGLIMALLAVGLGFLVTYVAFQVRGRRLFRRFDQVVERERLEDEVFPHLTEDEQELPWTLSDLRQLASFYRRRRPASQRGGT